MEESQTTEKWEGKFSDKLSGTKAEQVWPLLQDFCNLHKWLPSAETCRLVDGVSGQPGCVRYCSSSLSDGSTGWATERLVAADATERYITYEVVENNIGIGSYVATLKVLAGEEGCEIEWSFVADPVVGFKQEDFLAFLKSNLQGMVKRMEEALQVSKQD